MSAITPIEQVVRFLERHGYTLVDKPLEISGIEFSFPAALKGPEKSTDLILIADTAFESGEQIARVIQGIARALDVARSRRPLTAVVVGPSPSADILANMSSVCRVLPIGPMDDGKGEAVLRNWLAVLTPLKLPQQVSDISDPSSDLRARLTGLDEEVASITDVASQGSKAVMKRMNKILTRQLEGLPESDDG